VFAAMQRRVLPIAAASVLFSVALGVGAVSATTAPSAPADSASADSISGAPADSAASGTVPDPAECAQGLTLDDGVLTVATGDPAFLPYVVDDDPTSGDGFESAVAYAVAEQMGFDHDHVTWVRTTFDEAIQPGPKNFDFDIQQYGITPERSDVVTFSLPYYTTNQALVANTDTPAATAASLADVQALKLGVTSGTTSLTYVTDVIQPDSDPQIFNSNADLAAALETKQIDAIVVDLPTGIIMTVTDQLTSGIVVGQFPPADSAPGEDWGMLFEKDNPLADCVNYALLNLRASGELDEITTEWMVTAAGVPTIELDG
jgi:polar amino acid transport system substrate-binding protein